MSSRATPKKKRTPKIKAANRRVLNKSKKDKREESDKIKTRKPVSEKRKKAGKPIPQPEIKTVYDYRIQQGRA